jgi:predicted nucleic acid-binding protein
LNLYLDSSGIVAWLLGEVHGPEVIDSLGAASLVVCSHLTLVECDRALLRCLAGGTLDEAEHAELSALLAGSASEWQRLAITESILERARLPFAGGPLRTLDAIHLASALEGRAAVPGLAVLTLDDRMRRAARAAGFSVLPDSRPG